MHNLYIEDNQSIPAVIILADTEPAPSGYTDFTMDLIKWRDYGEKSCNDFLQFREYCREVLNSKTWAGLSDNEKWFMIDLWTKESTVDDTTDNTNKITFMMGTGMSLAEARSYMVNAYAKFHVKEIKASSIRASCEKIFVVVGTYLSTPDAADFFNLIKDLYILYEKQGIRGTQDSSAGEGLFDFIESTPGTSYEFAGLASQGYTMQNGDPDTSNFVIDLMNVLRHGNY